MLGDGDVVRIPYEAPKLCSRDRVLVHPKAVDADLAHGPLLRIEVLGAHPEDSSFDPCHSVWCWRELRGRHWGPSLHHLLPCHSDLEAFLAVIRWPRFSAASAMSICTHSTVPLKPLPSEV